MRLFTLELEEEARNLVLGGIGKLQLFDRCERIEQRVYQLELVRERVSQRFLRASRFVGESSCLHNLERVRGKPDLRRSMEFVAQFGAVEWPSDTRLAHNVRRLSTRR